MTRDSRAFEEREELRALTAEEFEPMIDAMSDEEVREELTRQRREAERRER